jgi:hypothetical protein
VISQAVVTITDAHLAAHMAANQVVVSGALATLPAGLTSARATITSGIYNFTGGAVVTNAIVAAGVIAGTSGLLTNESTPVYHAAVGLSTSAVISPTPFFDESGAEEGAFDLPADEATAYAAGQSAQLVTDEAAEHGWFLTLDRTKALTTFTVTTPISDDAFSGSYIAVSRANVLNGVHFGPSGSLIGLGPVQTYAYVPVPIR